MFKYLPMTLFAAGTAIAAISVAPPLKEEIWWLFAIGAGLIVAGIFVRLAVEKKAVAPVAETEDKTLSISQIVSIIRELPKKCKEILEQFESAEDPQPLFEKVDALSNGDLFNVVEGRAVLAQSLGSKVYPVLFGEFAEGERLFNRTWSALCDKHIGEARTSLSGAIEFFEKVSAELDKLSSHQA